MKRIVLTSLVVFTVVVAVRVGGDDPNPYAASQAQASGTKATSIELVQGKGVVWWSRRAVQARKDANARAVVLRRLRHARLVQFVPPYEHAATLAAIAYGVDAGTLIRKGRCESVNWTKFHNSSGASGPWQFLPSTWASTPYAAFSSYDPFAAALAAAWMHAHGRGGEWVCR